MVTQIRPPRMYWVNSTKVSRQSRTQSGLRDLQRRSPRMTKVYTLSPVVDPTKSSGLAPISAQGRQTDAVFQYLICLFG